MSYFHTVIENIGLAISLIVNVISAVILVKKFKISKPDAAADLKNKQSDLIDKQADRLTTCLEEFMKLEQKTFLNERYLNRLQSENQEKDNRIEQLLADNLQLQARIYKLEHNAI